jgi:hypothetical protein
LLAFRRMLRLHWGCGERAAPGWLNVDRRALDGVDIVSEIREGLPLGPASCDYAVSIHALQDLAYLDVVPALQDTKIQRVAFGQTLHSRHEITSLDNRERESLFVEAIRE